MNIDNYWEIFHPVQVTLCNDDGSKHISFTDYHKSISDIFGLINNSGLTVSKVAELYDKKPDKKFVNQKIVERYSKSPPPFIYIEALKS